MLEAVRQFFHFIFIQNALLAAILLSALGLEYLSQGRTVREDSAIGMLWSFGMAVGTLFVFPWPGYALNLMSFFWQHPNHFKNRHFTITNPCRINHFVFCGFLLPNSIGGFR